MPRSRVVSPSPPSTLLPRTTVRQISTFALFVPLLVIVAALLLSGHHSREEWALAVTMFLGAPLVVLLMRRRARQLTRARPARPGEL